MTNKKEIYEFILKWYDKFTKKNIDKKEIDYHIFGVEYTLLNIVKIENLPEISSDFFRRLWEEKSIELLLNISYGIWEKFYKENGDFNEVWIANKVKILRRILVLLEAGNYKKFIGKIKKFSLKSSNLYYEKELDIKDIEQIFILEDDEFSLERYVLYNEEVFLDIVDDIEITEKEKEQVIELLERYFSRENLELNQKIGDWELILTNEKGEEFCYTGTYMPYSFEKIDNISEFIRDICNEEMFLFDNLTKLDTIENIEVKYTRTQDDLLIEENIIINRERDSIEYIRKNGEDEFYKRYIKKKELKRFLDSFDLENFFKIKLNPPSDILKNPLNKKRYFIEVDYKYQKIHKVSGDYHKCDLPSDWIEFLEKLQNLAKEEEMDIFNKEFYKKIPLRKNQYIYCEVEFYENSKRYYYRTFDDTILVGDKVIVPVNKYNSEFHGKVVSVEYYFEVDVPYPLKETKFIIKKV